MKAGPKTIAVVVFAMFAVAASSIAWFQATNNRAVEEQRFASLTGELASFVRERMALYEYGLRGARGAILVVGGKAVTRADFTAYFRSRDLLDEFPGSRGIGFAERVGRDQTEEFLARARADGFPEFTLRELSSSDAERFIIKYIYPLEGNEGATGLDIGSESNRRRASIEAARTGQATITEPITLVQASGQVNAGFLILLPVYAEGTDTASLEDRVRGTIGWSYMPIVVTEVLDALEVRLDQISFAISDGGTSEQFYRSPGFDPDLVGSTIEISVYGRSWRIASHPSSGFRSTSPQENPYFVFGLVLAVGAILAWTVLILARTRKRQQALQRRSAELTESIVEGAPMALLVLDRERRITRANQQAIELFGRDADHLAGQRLDDIVMKPVNHGDPDAPAQATPIGGDGRTSLESVFLVEHADGSPVPVVMKISSNVLSDEGFSIAGILDFSAQMDAYRILTESEQRWQELANHLPHLVWTADRTGEYDFLSRQWETYTGISISELAGSRWLVCVHPDDRAGLSDLWKRTASDGSSFSAEFRIRRHDGHYRRFYLLADTVLDTDGTVLRWVGSNTDIEDRYRAEREVHDLLREMEKRVADRTAELDNTLHDLNSILDAINVPIGYWDRNQVNRIANKAHRQWYGRDPEWLKGRHARELLGDELYEFSLERINGVLSGEPQQWEREMVDANGARHVVQVNYIPDQRDGEFVGYYVILFDITEARASEAAQKEARKAAEQATQAKSAFLTSMSHELRTPLNSILGFSDLMLSQHFGELTDKQLIYSRMIRKSGEHLLNLMNSVLELSKIEAGRVAVSIDSVNVVATVRSVIATLEPLAEARSITISRLKAIPVDLFVEADQTRLIQILTNLGSNAIKYNRPDGWIQFGCEVTTEGLVRISVADNGLGIREDRQAGAFQPFNRLGAEQGTVEGTGIGLALVKNYIELMGGRIDFTSREGEGSRFWIEIPMADEKAAQPERTSVNVVEPRKFSRNSIVSLLYVEDNDINRELFRNYAEMIGGISLAEAHNGVEGLKFARSSKPDIIFLDINLPGLDGYEVIKALRANPETAGISVIALTANAMAGDADKGLEAGFDRYLTKPVRLSHIQDVIAEYRKEMTRRASE